MPLDEVIRTTLKIIATLKAKGIADGVMEYKLDCLVKHAGARDEVFHDALEYLCSACTAARGLRDIYVEGLTMKEWWGMILDMQHALDAYSKSIGLVPKPPRRSR